MKAASILIALLLLALGAASPGRAADTNPPEWIYRPKGNYEGQTDRPLRYRPDGTDFVITNGTEFFNRPLYCLNSAFRVDGGDKPEFSIYLPGRGGNLRFGIKTPAGLKWLNDAEKIVARYRPGSMLYDIRDPLLGNRELHLAVLPLSATKGIVVRAEVDGAGTPLELVWAFGGANGMRGRRGGDIGCEREPVSQFFQLKPEQCQGNEITIASNTFVLHSKPATIAGVASAGAKLAVGDATKWAKLDDLLASALERRAPARHDDSSASENAGSETGAPFPVIVGQAVLPANQPVYLALQQTGDGPPAVIADDLPKKFIAAEEHRRAIAERVVVDTPDPFINAAAAALECRGGRGLGRSSNSRSCMARSRGASGCWAGAGLTPATR